METLVIASENDFKRWIKEVVIECLGNLPRTEVYPSNNDEPLLTRKDIAKKLGISLVTLTDWAKRGLPSHKQRGRVYFIYSEVIKHIKTKDLKRHPELTHYLENLQ